jgi:CRISPR-associated protein (Cas_Csd1)
MQINSVVSPTGIDRPYGYAPMDVGIEILLGSNGQIGPADLMPLETDDKTRKRFWLPDLPRTSGIAPIVGSDKLDYYHPTRKPQAFAAMVEILKQRGLEVPELQWVIEWMQSDRPLELERQISEKPKADIIAIESGRIVWRLEDGTYIHDIPAIRSAHAAQTLARAIGNGDGDLLGALPRIHSKKLAAPLLGCNDDMFRSWGQHEKMALNISATQAVIATQKYTELLEAKGHNIWLGDSRYWVWGALPEMAAISEAGKEIAAFLDSDGAADLDPVQALEDIINRVKTGAKGIGKIPDDLKIACGYIGIGGSGKGRAAIGQMTELSALQLLNNLLFYHQQQRRYLTISKPYWVFGALTVAEGSSKQAVAKANEQIFEAMIGGHLPTQLITNNVIHRLKIEGVPNVKGKKTNRAWAQITYLAWLSPNFIEINQSMKPDTTTDNLLAWHVGRVFAACKTLSYFYAHPNKKESETESNDSTDGKESKQQWKDPLDTYRQNLFSSPAQGFIQIITKISPYLAARPEKAIWYNKTIAELAEDCPNVAPPKRWTDEQAFFLALGISQFQVERLTANADKKSKASQTTDQDT